MSSTTDKITEQEQQDFNPQNNPQDPQQLLLQTHLHHLQMQTPSPSTTDPFSLCNFTSAPRAGLVFSDVPPSPWSNIPPVQPFNPDPVQYSPYPSTSAYGGWFGRRPTGALQWAYDGSGLDQVRILSEAIGPVGLQAELMKMTAQEIMDAKALAASKSHSEAERRRRERINNHLAKLRSLLPSTTKTDKASLLAEVIQHVKELKRQTSIIAETSPVPTETDELTIDPAGESSSDPTGRFVFKASICCDDRSDLLPDLIKALKALRLKTLKAEITTLGGRVKNVLFITGDETDPSEPESSPEYSISSIEEALRGVMEKSGGDDSASGNVKRQRTNTAVSTGNVQYS